MKKPPRKLLSTTCLGAVLATGLCVFALDASAATKTWNNAGSTDWTNGANWTGGAPGAADTAVINLGATGPNILTTVPTVTTVQVGTTAANGTLNISAGGTLADTDGYLGYNAGSAGTATVSGAGASWSNTGNLKVGNFGTGTLMVSNGGRVSGIGIGYVAANAGAVGTVTVTDTDSLWTTSINISIGYLGTGTLTIQNGGGVSSIGGTVGGQLGATGTTTVTGTGSNWTSSQGLNIGNFGTGTLTISNGASISNVTIAIIGNRTTGVGTATVTGGGSSWGSASSFYLGRDGTGTLTIAEEGAVTIAGGIGTLTIAENLGSTGTLNIGAGALAVAAAPGTLSTSTLAFGAGTGTLVFNHTDASYAFNPTITGAGTIKTVAGTTILSGDLSGFTGTADLTGGILTYGFSGDSTIGAALSGAGDFSVSSGGTTTITSNSAAFTGTTTVNNGSTLSLGGSLGGTLDVSSGGTLKGTGTAEDVTTNAGSVIAPGNSIGTLTVVNLIANPGSTYEVEVETDGTSDLIHATGTATLNGGTVELIPYSGLYHPDIVYTIVTADGGVAGTYDDITLSQPSLFITPTLSYDANNVYATTTRNGTSFASVADTANQKATAAALDPLGVSNLAYEAVVNIGDAASAQAAFDQLSGEIYAGLQNALIGEQHSIGTMLFDRLDRLGERTASIEPFKVAYAGDDLRGMFPKGRRMNVWAQGFGSWGNVDGNANSASVDSNSGGLMLGAEGDLNDAWQGGGAIGYSVTNANSSARASKASSKNYHAALYAGTNPEEDEPVLRLGANTTWHALQSARDIDINGFSDHTTADYNAYTAQAFVDVSQPVSMDSNSTLAPFGTVSYIHQSTQGFTERGGDASLNVDDTNSDLLSSTFGLRGNRRFTFDESGAGPTATLNASLGWKHTFGDVTPESTAQFTSGSDSFSVKGTPLASDAFVYDTSLSFQIDNNISIGIHYAGQLAPDAQSQSLRGQIKYSF